MNKSKYKIQLSDAEFEHIKKNRYDEHESFFMQIQNVSQETLDLFSENAPRIILLISESGKTMTVYNKHDTYTLTKFKNNIGLHVSKNPIDGKSKSAVFFEWVHELILLVMLFFGVLFTFIGLASTITFFDTFKNVPQPILKEMGDKSESIQHYLKINQNTKLLITVGIMIGIALIYTLTNPKNTTYQQIRDAYRKKKHESFCEISFDNSTESVKIENVTDFKKGNKRNRKSYAFLKTNKAKQIQNL